MNEHAPVLILQDLFLSFGEKEETPVCVACNTVITVKHTLIECADSVEVRKKYLGERSLYSLFQNVNPEKMFDFLKETDTFKRI